MSYAIPRNPAWCTRCIAPEMGSGQTPCPDHRGRDGRPIEYSGLDAYTPSEWVLRVVGKNYVGPDIPSGPMARVYECFGYDPRSGFWVRTIDDHEFRQTNISERAIGGTYHRVTMTSGAWTLLDKIVELGHLPTDADMPPGFSVKFALHSLRNNRLVNEAGLLTDRGHAIFERRTELFGVLYLD